jgi:hypothetical protein
MLIVDGIKDKIVQKTWFLNIIDYQTYVLEEGKNINIFHL